MKTPFNKTHISSQSMDFRFVYVFVRVLQIVSPLFVREVLTSKHLTQANVHKCL